MRVWLGLICIFFGVRAMAEDNVVNVYVWSQEVSEKIIAEFEKDTGIKVNYSTFDSNEVLYSKLKASQTAQYDVIEPSGYYISRMAREGMIEKINFALLPNYKNINPSFRQPEYDPKGEYSIPWVWGVTGIFVNRNYYPSNHIENWTDLWSPQYHDALLLLNDPRDVFSMGLLSLHYSPNDENATNLENTYHQLIKLLPNVRLYNSSSVPSMLIDEDAAIGMAWNADAYKAKLEQPSIEFIYPKDGFVIWVDAFAIPRNPPHRDNAYRFLNYLLQAKIAAMQVQESYYATANEAAIAYLPAELRNSKTIFPNDETLRRGHIQTDINNEALGTLSRYWQLLKLQ